VGFNLLVRLVLRVGAFIIGLVGGILIVGVLDDTFTWFWLPLLMGVAVSAVVSIQPWFRATRLPVPFCASLACGTAFSFCLSTSSVTTRIGKSFPIIALCFGFGLLLISIAIFAARGLGSKETRAMTAWLFIPIAACMIVGYVSGGIGGADHMVAWVIAVLHLSRDQADVVVHYFRKGIHVSAYGILGLSLFRGALAGSATKARAFAFAMMIAFCVASFDELRQTTAPNRNGSPWDVALDMTGASVFVALTAAFLKRPKTPITFRA